MDGTGDLSRPFLRALPPGSEATVVAYPARRVLGYRDLRPIVEEAVPRSGPYILVAESFSGPLAIAHAATRPTRLRALVLVATFTRNPLPPSLRWLRALARPALFRVSPPREAVRAVLAGRGAPADLVDAIRATTRRVDPAVMARRLREVLSVNVDAEAASVEVPTLYLAGAADRLVGLRGLAQVSARIPGLEARILEGPHLLLQARPEATVRELLRFLDGS